MFVEYNCEVKYDIITELITKDIFIMSSRTFYLYTTLGIFIISRRKLTLFCFMHQKVGGILCERTHAQSKTLVRFICINRAMKSIIHMILNLLIYFKVANLV